MSTRITLAALALAASASSQQLVYEPAQLVEGLEGLGQSFDSFAVADLDGDGLDDIVDPLVFGPLRVALAFGDGSFAVTHYSGKTYPLKIADIDEDGVLDLLHIAGTSIAYSPGLGDGTFADAVSIVPAGGAASIDIGDVNGDGHTDFAYTQGILFFASQSVLLGQGDGTFVVTPDLPPPSGLGSAIQLGDVDGDGLDDIVLNDNWLRSLGDGSFAAPLQAPGGELVDLLGDAAVEFVSLLNNSTGVHIIVRALDGDAFVSVVQITLPFEIFAPSVSATDADGDGQLDLVVTGEFYGVVYRQQAGTFELAASFTTLDETSQFNASAATTIATGPRDLVYRTTSSGVAVARNVTYADDTPFTDLGGNTPGSVGFPTQVLEADGADLSVRVLAAAPSSPVFAIWGGSLGAPLGLSATSPSPDRILGPFTASPLGTFEVATSDALPLGLGVYAQWWIVDPSTGLASTSTVLIDG